MRRIIIMGLVALALCLTAAPALAEAPTWRVDPPHCAASFTVRHILVQVPGFFHDFSGEVRFAPDDLAGSSVDVSIGTASVDTGVAKRDKHLRSADFLDVAKYPRMRFVSTDIQRQGDGYVAHGQLTIKDVTRPVSLPFKFVGTKKNPMEQSQTVAGFTAQLAIDRLDYHVGDGRFAKMGVTGREVVIELNLELLRP